MLNLNSFSYVVVKGPFQVLFYWDSEGGALSKMIDFHNHVLPNIDDGSKSMSMSIEMLENALSQGITDVVNTVHFQHPKVENMDISFQRIKKEIDILYKKNLITVISQLRFI